MDNLENNNVFAVSNENAEKSNSLVIESGYTKENDIYKKISFGKISRISFVAAIIFGLSGIFVHFLWFFGGVALVIAVTSFIVNITEKSFVKPENRIDLNNELNNYLERRNDANYQTVRYNYRVNKAQTLNKLAFIIGSLISTLIGISLAVAGLILLRNPNSIKTDINTEKIKSNSILAVFVSCVALFIRWYILQKIFS